ncbi:hypothetical protein [Hymenobacter sp. YC55]|uniref:hypothetical protein n=1 Tax=Hymenobacter sp. YC55 TaxID=3034019 RepID=UPI0023F85DC1|nr:hypothetical protein [Hymenobacter sp. YC55]MDF7811053.1 hypothetical protein [Hymenobacter sp. YC55]
MITRLLPIAVLLLISAAAAAQSSLPPPIEQTGAAARDNIDALGRGDAAVVRKPTSAGVIGTPYADNRWLLARITLSTKLPLAPVPLKYDVLNQRLLMRPLDRGVDSLQLDDRAVTRFELDDPVPGTTTIRKRVFRRFEEALVPNQRMDYVEVLHEGRYSLLKRYVKLLRKANNTGAYNTGQQYDQVEDKNVYYLRRPDASLVPLKLSVKTLQAAMPELAAALKESGAAQKAKTDVEWANVLDTLDPK